MTDPGLARELIRIIGAFALVALAGVILLLALEVDATAVAVVAGLCGTAIGALATLATTRTAPGPEEQLAAAESRLDTIDEVNQLGEAA